MLPTANLGYTAVNMAPELWQLTNYSRPDASACSILKKCQDKLLHSGLAKLWVKDRWFMPHHCQVVTVGSSKSSTLNSSNTNWHESCLGWNHVNVKYTALFYGCIRLVWNVRILFLHSFLHIFFFICTMRWSWQSYSNLVSIVNHFVSKLPSNSVNSRGTCNKKNWIVFIFETVSRSFETVARCKPSSRFTFNQW